MNKTLVVVLVVISGIVLAALAFGAGLFIGRTNLGFVGNGPARMMGYGSNNNNPGYSMMSNGYNLMGGNGMTLAPGCRTGVGSFQSNNTANVKPLTIDQATQAVEGYLKDLNNSDLELKEIMIFDNNAYARITEKSTGIGAMELLVDPSTLAVFPEYGPNMMWNLKYGLMSGNGSMMGNYGNNPGPSSRLSSGGMMGGRGGGMMGNSFLNPGTVSETMTIAPEQALKITQEYLDQQFPGYQAAEDADPFYGYYTIDIMKDGEPAGMLSVNGFNGQVFLHTWHGTFIEMSE
jgi:hypothetical protein